MDVGTDRFYLRKHYSEAIFEAGGIPVMIPLIARKEYIRELVGGIDGILLSGSNSDVDPHRYREEPHPKIGAIMSRRDQTDLFLLEEVFHTRKPLLGICFGIQILNVYLGGSLWQDVDSQVKESIKHDQDTQEARSHTIRIRPKTLLHRLARKTVTIVNSFHHQAIRTIAPPLRAVAKSSDGLIEAVELRTPRKEQFLLGVQWHPEIGWETDELSQKIFSCFIEATRA